MKPVWSLDLLRENGATRWTCTNRLHLTEMAHRYLCVGGITRPEDVLHRVETGVIKSRGSGCKGCGSSFNQPPHFFWLSSPPKKVEGDDGIAPTTPAWKAGVYLSTLIPREMDVRLSASLSEDWFAASRVQWLPRARNWGG